MSTHIAANVGDIAETVLLPGDPLRGKWVAKTFLKKVRRYSTVRNMFGYTGITPGGNRISVQGSGMGMPSLSIYIHELINIYKVKRIIRFGSCGAMQKYIKVRDIIIAAGSCSDSAINLHRFPNLQFAPIADFDLLLQTHISAKKLKIPILVGNIFATDLFYAEHDRNGWRLLAEYGVLAAEMETAELYTVAAKKKIQALSILTVSDNIVTHAKLSSKERENTFVNMMKIILHTIDR